MTLLTIIIAFALIALIIVQVSKINELSKGIRGEEQSAMQTNKRQALYLLVFGVLFLIFTVVSAIYYKNYMLGYGPHEAASEHGPGLDQLFNTTLIITGIVFVITHIALFYFSYKYRFDPSRKALFMPHDNKLEIIWTAIPAFAMFALVINGLILWNKVMVDVEPGEDYLEIGATGMQYSWIIRYPGPDGNLGSKNFRLINSINSLGQDWSDLKNLDDFLPTDIVLPKGKKVRVRISARDVLHNFYLPHFRVKMDAVPGLPTHFVFTPTKTTQEYRDELSKYKEYQVPADPTDPDGPQKWEVFDYELACAELCGYGHYSMRRKVVILEPDEYEAWARQQQSFYLSSIRGTDEDPYEDQLFDFEVSARKQEFDDALNAAIAAPDTVEKIVELKYVSFETGSAALTELSRYELDNVVAAMGANSNLQLELRGHTDNTGDADANMSLSSSRALTVMDYLTTQGVDPGRLSATGYGQTLPRDTNDTEEGRARNRRTELKVITF